MKWGLLGGTFDPIHTGHLRCAEEIREMFALDKVLFIPAARPPHKDDVSVASFYHREKMIRLAVVGNRFFAVSDMENRREGISYSVDTVEQLLLENPRDLEIYFILGHDAFRLIRTWKDWQRLIMLCNLVVMTRPGCEQESLERILPPDFARRFIYDDNLKGYRHTADRFIFFRQVSLLDISSSYIRERVKNGQSARYLVPEAVLSYIEEHGCYR